MMAKMLVGGLLAKMLSEVLHPTIKNDFVKRDSRDLKNRTFRDFITSTQKFTWGARGYFDRKKLWIKSY